MLHFFKPIFRVDDLKRELKDNYKMSVARNIRLLSWFSFFSAFKLYSAFAVIYFTNVTHSAALGISILSITQIADAAFEIPTGFMSDKIGRKQILFLGAFAKLISLLCYAMGQSYIVFVIGSIFDGFALALFSGNNEALLYDSAVQIGGKEKYHSSLGKIRSVAYPSLLIASILGSLFATQSIPFLFWLSTIPQTICIVIALLIVEPQQHKKEVGNTYIHFKESIQLLYRNVQLKRLSIAEIITQGIEDVVFQLQLLFYNMLWPLWAVGLTRSIMAFSKFISFRYSGKLINRYSPTKVLVINSTVTRVIHLLSILLPTLASPLLMSSTGFLWGSIEVARNTLLQEQFTSRQRATMYSVLSLFGSIFSGLLGLLVGTVSDRIGIINTLLVLQLFFIPIILSYTQFHRSHKK